ncbi:hypothetical protein QBC36DRAFT_291756 [Triangularia setosa]|uniref:NYN domain-containing protein n=1 Tax=Triangularia setosa TaxID=2587417 RepID=A0AAN7A6J7_9PEZI|nr:hypothetical protein QBC36DRAFT_291756 [Podospora setosa]
MDIENEECLLFVDDSNVWIEAQKSAASGISHMPKLTDGDHDPRLRINMVKLVNTLCNGQIQCHFKTKIYDRGANGKEKEVDNSMSSDLIEEAVELRVSAKFRAEDKQRKHRTVFIVITGDRDMLPAVRKVLARDIRVELWGWNSGMVNEYLKERNNNPLFSVKFLDTIFREVSFANYRSTRNTRVVPANTIVIFEPEGLVGQTWDETFVAKTLLQLDRLFYITHSKTGPEIFVKSPEVSNIKAIILKAQELFGEKTTIMSWPVYTSSFNRDVSVIVETSNMFLPLENDNQSSTSPHNTMNEAQLPHGNNTKLGNSPEHEDEHMEAREIQSLSKDPDNQEGWQPVKS